MDASNALRIVILGKFGAGKSSLANTIFGEKDRFMIGHTLNSETRECQAETKSVNGRNITLIDTPGFFDTDRFEEELKPEIVRCIAESAPGPHAFLIVLKVEKFTKQEQAVITKINQYFSEEVFKYATVVFTHGDQLNEGQTIEDFVNLNKVTSELVNRCGGRCHVVDNRYWKNNQQDEYRNNQFQVERLLKSMEETLVANNRSCYTNEMLQAVEDELKNDAATGALSTFWGFIKGGAAAIFRKGAGAHTMSDGTASQKALGAARAESALTGAVKGGDARYDAVSNTTRIVILGKTGAGKSSLANTIFEEKDQFKIGHTGKSETSGCRAETKTVNGKSFTLIDTPGLFDTDRPEEEMKPEIVRCITECAPGPHAFLILLKVEKFTKQEQAVITEIGKYFSEECFKYVTVLFTHGNQLDEGQTIEDFVQSNKQMSDLMEKCGDRCHVIDNKYWQNKQQEEYRTNQFQVKELFKTIDTMIEANKGSCYTNEMLQAVEEQIQQEEELITPSSGNMSKEEIREQAKGSVLKSLLTKLAGIATAALLETLCGALLVVGKVVAAIKKPLQSQHKFQIK